MIFDVCFHGLYEEKTFLRMIPSSILSHGSIEVLPNRWVHSGLLMGKRLPKNNLLGSPG